MLPLFITQPFHVFCWHILLDQLGAVVGLWSMIANDMPCVCGTINIIQLLIERSYMRNLRQFDDLASRIHIWSRHDRIGVGLSHYFNELRQNECPPLAVYSILSDWCVSVRLAILKRLSASLAGLFEFCVALHIPRRCIVIVDSWMFRLGAACPTHTMGSLNKKPHSLELSRFKGMCAAWCAMWATKSLASMFVCQTGVRSKASKWRVDPNWGFDFCLVCSAMTECGRRWGWYIMILWYITSIGSSLLKNVGASHLNLTREKTY